MKKVNQVLKYGVLVLCLAVVFSGCKKKSDPVTYPSVAFIITYLEVDLQGGGKGVQFYANCSTTDVKMTKVEILDPLHSQTVTYNLNGNGYVKGQIFALQDDNTAYLKQGGTWTITFTGLRTVDSAPFSLAVTTPVSK
jgi:hypothetical protein